MPVQFSNGKQTLDRNTLVSLVRQWGHVNTDGILDSKCQIFTHPAIQGLIGYRVESDNAVVFGDPLCAVEDKPALAHAFQQFCLNNKLGVVYIIASEEFATWASQNLSSKLIEFGMTCTLNPCDNPLKQTNSKSALLRKKVKRAQHEGILITEYARDNASIEKTIEEIATAWQKDRKGPQIYLCHPTLFNDRLGKRWFYAKQGEQIVGFLILNELKQQNGWLLNNVMITKEAANCVSELLVISVLQTLEKENCQSVTIGPVPRKHLGKIIGLNGVSKLIIHFVYKLAKAIFKLGGHEVFWEKFQPKTQAAYLIFPKNNLSFSSIKAIIKALNARI
jgi:lysylphosphatidylglycerol synthetase-like protein (DUF2156 family)